MRPTDQNRNIEKSDRTLVLKIGSEQYGLPVWVVIEVFEAPMPLSPLPGAPVWLGGVINNHGQVVPVIWMSTFFGLESTAVQNQVVLIEIHDERLGLLVDRIESLEPIRAEDVSQLKGRGRCWHKGALLELLDPFELSKEFRVRLVKHRQEVDVRSSP